MILYYSNMVWFPFFRLRATKKRRLTYLDEKTSATFSAGLEAFIAKKRKSLFRNRLLRCFTLGKWGFYPGT